MMSLFLILGTFSTLSSSSLAATLRAEDFSLTAHRKQSTLEIIATPPTEHHFNTKAPMHLNLTTRKDRLLPNRATENEVHFKIPSRNINSFYVTLFICDNANTYCEKHVVEATWNPQESRLSESTHTFPRFSVKSQKFLERIEKLERHSKLAAYFREKKETRPR